MITAYLTAMRRYVSFYAANAELDYPKVKQNEATFAIGYTSELTDDGKDVYVTFDGL